jgi:poly-gamma-glutamate system protein
MKSLASVLGNRNTCLLGAFLVAVIGLALIETQWRESVERSDAGLMRLAVAQAVEWFEAVGSAKQKRGIVTDARTSIKYGAMLGSDWSSFTTTLGSLEAKEIAANPDFAALVVRWLDEAGIDSTDTVGVMISGSFPSLAISVFAALRALGIEAVVVSSLGASSYGANQPGATWIDIESWLAEDGSFEFRSSLVTMGAEWDAGGGLSEEGIEEMRLAAKRNGVDLFVPGSLEESIAVKTALFEKRNVKLIINIGGNQASLGTCPHSAAIRNGYHNPVDMCRHANRGIILRLMEKGVPYIHMVNIKDLALRYCISADAHARGGSCLYNRMKVNKIAVCIFLLLIASPILFCYNVTRRLK